MRVVALVHSDVYLLELEIWNIVHLRAGQSYSRELAEVLGAVLVCLSILGNCMARYFQCSLGTL